MRRFLVILTAFAAVTLLIACAAEESDGRVEALQRQYAEENGCTARVSAAIARGHETARYALNVTRSDGETRVTVTEPEALAGVSAVVHNDQALSLEFDGMVLDAGSLDPHISAVNASDIVLRAVAEGYVTERSTGRFDDADALRVCFETEHAGEKLMVTAYFDDTNALLYAEIERDGEILAYLEFTEFHFGDIIPK